MEFKLINKNQAFQGHESKGSNVVSIRELSLFTGAGGGVLGTSHLLGWETVCYVEWNKYAARVLDARIADGFLHDAPIWTDVQTFNGHPWRGHVDVISGGFPCQDISIAGKGAGIEGERSGMWKEFARIIREVRPEFVFVENSPALTFRGLDVVLGDLAFMGYDAEWCVLGAADVGANHRRDRIWILAYANNRRIKRRKWDGGQTCEESLDWKNIDGGVSGNVRQQSEIHTEVQRNATDSGVKRNATIVRNTDGNCESAITEHDETSGVRKDAKLPDADGSQCCRNGGTFGIQEKHANTSDSCWWEVEPGMGRVANGVANRMDRLRAIGNGQVPLVAATAWGILINRIMNQHE